MLLTVNLNYLMIILLLIANLFFIYYSY